MNFDDLKLAPAILKAVHEQGYETPTPIQAQAIPAVLEGHDLLGGAQTGTGKTAAFTLPMLHKLTMSRSATNKFGGTGVRALVLTPTRELAAQVEESIRTYGKYLQLSSTVIFGGVGMNPQIDRLRRGVDILVATPGRLLDLQATIQRGSSTSPKLRNGISSEISLVGEHCVESEGRLRRLLNTTQECASRPTASCTSIPASAISARTPMPGPRGWRRTCSTTTGTM
jgi:superfamily II DNA helicase RecQ